jgi:Tol biopolymer transport system component
MSDAMRRCAILLAVATGALIQSACGSDGPTAQTKSSSGITVLIHAHGNGRDADGFTLSVDGSARTTASYDSPVVLKDLSASQHALRLTGVASHCFAASDSVVRQVNAGVMDTVAFDVTCIGGFVYHDLTSATDAQIIYVGTDGHVVPVTTGPGRRQVESWSPDGARLAFANDGSGSQQLYTIRLDGTGLATLSSGSGINYWAHWSPDGSRVAFTHIDNQNGGAWIVIVNADGTGAHPLVDSTHYDFDAVWSADGTRLYFSCNRFDSMTELCSSSQDGSDVQPVRLAAITALGPLATPQKWDISEDGRSLAFETLGTSSQGDQSAWVAAVDGSSATRLSTSSSFAAKWSPNSDRLVVETWNGQQNFGLATVSPNGTGFLPISNFADNDESPSWSPDGSAILLESSRSGSRQIWIANADGSGRHQLTTGAETKYTPMFSPKAGTVGTLTESALIKASH